MSVQKTVYLIPGLGATSDIFDKIKFPKEYVCVHLEWKKPKKKDTLESYALRLLPQIKDPSNAILCGLSFGGIIAVEMAKQIEVDKVILISSVKTRKEFPNTIKLAKLFPVHRLVSARMAVKFDFWYRLPFGKTNAEEKQLIKGMINVLDVPFTDWCANAAVKWKNKTVLPNIYHIHGTSDLVFPSFHIKNYFKIKKGSHFMIVNRADEINEIIEKEILV